MRASWLPKFLLASTCVALVFLGGCQTAPVQEMSDARQAISVAKAAGAEIRAEDQIRAASDLLESAERHLSERQYGSARQDATEAKLKALDALQRSEASSPPGQ